MCVGEHLLDVAHQEVDELPLLDLQSAVEDDPRRVAEPVVDADVDLCLVDAAPPDHLLLRRKRQMLLVVDVVIVDPALATDDDSGKNMGRHWY